jgi:hypothetical protein
LAWCHLCILVWHELEEEEVILLRKLGDQYWSAGRDKIQVLFEKYPDDLIVRFGMRLPEIKLGLCLWDPKMRRKTRATCGFEHLSRSLVSCPAVYFDWVQWSSLAKRARVRPKACPFTG